MFSRDFQLDGVNFIESTHLSAICVSLAAAVTTHEDDHQSLRDNDRFFKVETSKAKETPSLGNKNSSPLALSSDRKSGSCGGGQTTVVDDMFAFVAYSLFAADGRELWLTMMTVGDEWQQIVVHQQQWTTTNNNWLWV